MTTKKKKPMKKPGRTLLPLQRLIAAKEMQSGTPLKQVAADWKISRSYAAKIFKQYLVYKIEWQAGKEPTDHEESSKEKATRTGEGQHVPLP